MVKNGNRRQNRSLPPPVGAFGTRVAVGEALRPAKAAARGFRRINGFKWSKIDILNEKGGQKRVNIIKKR